MSFSKMVSKPRMFFEKLVRAITFKQLEGNTNTHGWGHFNKQVDMVNTDVKFINFESFFISHLPQKEFAIHSEPIKLEGVFGIFNFPDKMESILSKAMFSRFQIHFFTPKSTRTNTAHANFIDLIREGKVYPLHANNLTELNLVEQGNSSLGLKVKIKTSA